VRLRVFAGMLSAVDEGVGNVTKTLKAKGMWSSTIFIVTTDK
jgi:arylsulfatase B